MDPVRAVVFANAARRWLAAIAVLLIAATTILRACVSKGIGESTYDAKSCRSGQMLPSGSIGGICTKACRTDGDCPRVTVCRKQACVPRSSRTLGQACSGWWECANDQCLLGGPLGQTGVCTTDCGAGTECPSPNRCLRSHCVPPPTAKTGDPCLTSWECPGGHCVTDIATMRRSFQADAGVTGPISYCSAACPMGVSCPPGFGCRLADGERLCAKGVPDSPGLDVLDRAKTNPGPETLQQLLDLFNRDAGVTPPASP